MDDIRVVSNELEEIFESVLVVLTALAGIALALAAELLVEPSGAVRQLLHR